MKFTKEITKDILLTLNNISDKTKFEVYAWRLANKHNVNEKSVLMTVKNANYELGYKGLPNASKATKSAVKEILASGTKLNLYR